MELVLVVVLGVTAVPQAGGQGWPDYAGSLAGQRYSEAQEINRGNVSRLRQTWSVNMRPYEGAKPRGSFEATPVLWRGTLYLTTPKDVVVAVDAATARCDGRSDPGVRDEDVHFIATSRGVALWHDNLWDYDTASQPLLFTWHGDVPAVAVMNKTGMIYVFNRLTGEPLFPIGERAVPQTDVVGEQTWETQPFSSVEPLLSTRFNLDKMPEARADDERFCRRLMREVRYDGPFTPPSMRGTVIYPASLGGPNWGSSALDVKTGVMYTRVNSLAYLVWLSRDAAQVGAPAAKPVRNARDELKAGIFRPPDAALGGGGSAMGGTPYAVNLRALVGPGGTPCGGAPYGRMVATDLNSGKQVWSVPHGVMLSDVPGSVGMGGPIVTAGGVVFVGASRDAVLRGYDSATGKESWKGELPGAPSGTPMTYVVKGQQYVVIATGDEQHGDALVAFALGK